MNHEMMIALTFVVGLVTGFVLWHWYFFRGER